MGTGGAGCASTENVPLLPPAIQDQGKCAQRDVSTGLMPQSAQRVRTRCSREASSEKNLEGSAELGALDTPSHACEPAPLEPPSAGLAAGTGLSSCAKQFYLIVTDQKRGQQMAQQTPSGIPTRVGCTRAYRGVLLGKKRVLSVFKVARASSTRVGAGRGGLP